MKEIMKYLLQQFLFITALIIIGLGIAYAFDETQELNHLFLIRIVLTGFLSALPTLIFFIPKLKFIYKIIIHYIILNAIVLGLAKLFNYVSGYNWIFLIVFIFIVYVLVWVIELLVNQKEANSINKKILEIKDEE